MSRRRGAGPAPAIPPRPTPRYSDMLGGVTMAEAADAMCILSGLPMLTSTCSTCGAGYRPDPRDQRRCAYCGGWKFR